MTKRNRRTQADTVQRAHAASQPFKLTFRFPASVREDYVFWALYAALHRVGLDLACQFDALNRNRWKGDGDHWFKNVDTDLPL